MAGVIDVLRDAAGSLDYAIDALDAPAGSHMRDTVAELKEARKTVAAMLDALEKAESCISGFEGDEMQVGIGELIDAARAAIAKARGEA
jgi:hypothetical protein